MKVHLSNYPHFGVKTEVDGRELPEVTHIELTCPVDGLPQLHVWMNANVVDVELNADVHVHMEPGHCSDCRYLEPFDVNDAESRLFACPIIGIRLLKDNTSMFGCTCFEAK